MRLTLLTYCLVATAIDHDSEDNAILLRRGKRKNESKEPYNRPPKTLKTEDPKGFVINPPKSAFDRTSSPEKSPSPRSRSSSPSSADYSDSHSPFTPWRSDTVHPTRYPYEFRNLPQYDRRDPLKAQVELEAPASIRTRIDKQPPEYIKVRTGTKQIPLEATDRMHLAVKTGDGGKATVETLAHHVQGPPTLGREEWGPAPTIKPGELQHFNFQDEKRLQTYVTIGREGSVSIKGQGKKVSTNAMHLLPSGPPPTSRSWGHSGLKESNAFDAVQGNQKSFAKAGGSPAFAESNMSVPGKMESEEYQWCGRVGLHACNYERFTPERDSEKMKPKDVIQGKKETG